MQSRHFRVCHAVGWPQEEGLHSTGRLHHALQSSSQCESLLVFCADAVQVHSVSMAELPMRLTSGLGSLSWVPSEICDLRPASFVGQ